MILKDFSGGLFTRAHPSLISQTESQEYTNCDNEAGILRPIKNYKDSIFTSKHYYSFFYAADKLVSSDKETHYIEYRNVMYSSNEDGASKEDSGGVINTIGIEKPEFNLLATKRDDGVLSGVYKYVYTYYNSKDGTESIPSSLSNEINISITNVVETGTPDTTDISNTDSEEASKQFKKRFPWILGDTFESDIQYAYENETLAAAGTFSSRVNYPSFISSFMTRLGKTPSNDDKEKMEDSFQYEILPIICSGKVMLTGMYPSTNPQVDKIRLYRLGGTLTHYTMVAELNANQDSYMDNNADWDIAGNHVLASFTYGIPPKGLKYLTESYAMLFGAKDDKLYYSDIGKPDSWPVTNFIDFNQAVTGIGPVQNGLLVFTEDKTYIITGNSPTSFSKYLLSGEQGCIKHSTIAFNNNLLMWLSSDGVCASNGGPITIVTQAKLGKIDGLSPVNAVVFDRVYYLSHSKGILCVDNRYNLCMRTLTIKGRLGRFKDHLYISKHDGNLKEMLTGEKLVMRYKSPLYGFSGISEYKKFKDFYIAYKGDITLSVFIDGEVVFSKKLDESKTTYDAKSLSTKQGYGLHFEIEGTGEMQEINFSAIGRENGR